MKKIFFSFVIFLFSFLSFRNFSFADTVRDVSVTFSSRNGDPSSEHGYSQIYTTFTYPEDKRVCLFLDFYNTYEGLDLYTCYLYSNYNGNIPEIADATFYYNGAVSSSSRNNYSLEGSALETGFIKFYPHAGNNTFIMSSNSSGYCPIFYDIEDVRAYIINGYEPTKPFDKDLKLDSFKIYSKGSFSSAVEGVQVAYNSIVTKPVWSDPNITEVEISIYAVNPAFNYNPRNYTYYGGESGVLHTLNIEGLTLHEQKFIVRATPYSVTNKGVSIAYELEFPSTFDQPLGDLVIKEPNSYPYSTTVDISGNQVPVQWTVSLTPIYIYETNNVENYYYGDEVSYPVLDPSVGDTYEETIINNYYNDYSSVVNNYNNSFDFDFGDISSGDIQTGYDDVGNFFNGIGSLISKLAQLISGLFPFLSPLVAITLISVIGLVVVVGGIVLFIKFIRNLLP